MSLFWNIQWVNGAFFFYKKYSQKNIDFKAIYMFCLQAATVCMHMLIRSQVDKLLQVDNEAIQVSDHRQLVYKSSDQTRIDAIVDWG